MNKQPAITTATKAHFIDAFCTLYAKKPIEKITVKELAEKAGYNRVTFYQYFRDIYDIQEELEEILLNRVLTQISENIHRGIQSERFVATIAETLLENEPMAQLFLCNPHNHHFAAKLTHDGLPRICRCLGIDCETPAFQYTLTFYVAGSVALISKWISESMPISADALGQLIDGILENGIFAQLPPLAHADT